MATPVFLTVDTELRWAHHVAGLPLDEIVRRSLEPAGVGVGYQLDLMGRHGLKGCFFVDPMPALVHGLGPIRRVVEAILDAGQEVQLHCHPNWTGADAEDRHKAPPRFDLADFSDAEQAQLLQGAHELLTAAGAPAPVAFRAGAYAANDATLDALVALGIDYDSSHNGAEHPRPSALSLPPRQIAPVAHCGLIEVPVTLVEDRPGSLRPLQLCAVSMGELAAAFDHAVRHAHGAVTIVSHGFELANRAGTRPNGIHVRRFERLCELLERRAAELPTAHFADRPALRLGSGDVPLGPDPLRTHWRRAEQLWSNWVEERAA